MSNSPLACTYVPSPASNHWGQRAEKIRRIIIHHAAGVLSAKALADQFANPKRKASATYVIGNDGTVIRCLDEGTVPGTSGGYDADKDSVTIEVSNSDTGDDWPVSSKALNSLILLCADIAKRNELGKLVKRKNLCWHSMYAATVCPGSYLLSKMDYLASESNKINGYFGGELSGNDIPRRENSLVLYIKGLSNNKKTGTNMWGYEVAIDRNGVVLEDPHYSGNTKIPDGGKILSGHGIAGKWICNNIRKGYVVWFSDGTTHIGRGKHHSVDSYNGTRKTDQLVIYNQGSASKTNMWGWEVAVNTKGHVTKKRYGGKTPIPKDGFVLSGHGKAASWINKNIKVGDNVTVNGNVVGIK